MSARGVGIGATGALLAAAGLLLRWPEAVAIGIALLGLLLAPVAVRGPSSATWADIAAPVRVVRGDPAHVAIAVTPGPGSIRWVSAVDAGRADRAFLPPAGADGPPAILIWPIDTSRRGLIHVGPARLEVGDPFGIRSRVLATREPSPVLVVPRVHAVDARGRRGATDAEDAEERAGSETFHSLREYVVGDPQKLVHWRSSARTGTLMVRRMVDTTVPWLLVVLDVNARAYDREGAIFEDFDAAAFEETVDTAASWAWHGCGPDQRVLLTTTSVSSTTRHLAAEVTARTRDSALDWLAVVDPQPASECGPGRVEALLRRQGVGRAVLLTGRGDAGAAAWVARWRRLAPVTVLQGHR